MRIRPRRGRYVTLSALVLGCVVALVTTAASGAFDRGQVPRTLAPRGAGAAGWRWIVYRRSPLGRRFGAALVWDGHELLEIGGSRTGSHEVALSGGAAFDPRTRRWRRIATAPDRVALLDGAKVWTGRELFVFGGQSPLGGTPPCCTAGLFDPGANRWSLSVVPVDQLQQPLAVWTGSRVFLAGITQRDKLEAAEFDPSSGVWTRIDPALPSGHPPVDLAMVATDRGVLLWSLWSRSEQTGRRSFRVLSGVDVLRLPDAGGWRLITGRWPQHQTVSNPVFTGRDVLLPPGQIWCGICSHPPPMDEHGYLVDPGTLRLRPIPHGPLDDLDPNVVWTGWQAISVNLGGELTGPNELVQRGDTAIWNPVSRRWTRGPRAPTPLVYDTAPVWDGTHLLALATSGQLLALGP